MIGGIFVVPAIIFGAMLWNINSEKEKKPAKLRSSLEKAVSRLYDIKIRLSRHEDIFSQQLETANILLDAFQTVLKQADNK